MDLFKENYTKKIIEFNQAMERYHRYSFYHKSGLYISSIIITLQIITFFNLLGMIHHATALPTILTFIAAYIVADFLSGIVHLYMDNNENYLSVAGPFVAAFHLHHKNPAYKKRHAIKIYFYESGTKWWLALYLLALFYCQVSLTLDFYPNLFFVSVGILSSIAEVSHYWCHNSKRDQLIINALQRYGFLLSKKHHAHHHLSDNMNYAFLNGLTDPFINKIANKWYSGYKNSADLHVLAYSGDQTANR